MKESRYPYKIKIIKERIRIRKRINYLCVFIISNFTRFHLRLQFEVIILTKHRIICGQFFWIVYSSVIAIVGLCNIILGTHALTLINSYQKEGPVT